MTRAMTSTLRIEEGVQLARLTTIGTGGPARWFAQPETLEELEELLRWAQAEGNAVETIGLGSNVLAHDDGVDALVLRLAGALAEVRLEGEIARRRRRGDERRLPPSRAGGGLGGFEFASAIPGTAGGGVRMNAGAYGREFRDVVVDAVVVSADGSRTLTSEELELGYRHSTLRPGEVVAQVRLRLAPRDPAAIKADVATLLAQRKSTQPTNKRTFGSVFKNPAPSSVRAGRSRSAASRVTGSAAR